MCVVSLFTLWIFFNLLYFFRALKSRPGVEITPVNGDAPDSPTALGDLQKKGGAMPGGGKPSKLESALDRLGLSKRKVG